MYHETYGRKCLPSMAFGHQTSLYPIWPTSLKLGGQGHGQ